jgi:hypothetical protein
LTTAQDVIAVAGNEVGYIESGGADGHSGNITKYWAELDPALEGQSWCASFVSWVFKHAGFPLPAMDRPYGYVNCLSAVHYAQAHGLFDASGHYEPGDIILYGLGGGQHTGIVVSDDGVNIHTIEGNTTPDGGLGSQSNGGGVYRRVRSHGPWVFGVMKTSRLLAASTPVPAPHPAPPGSPAPQPQKGLVVNVIDLTHASSAHPVTGPGVRPMQRLLGVTPDGAAGDATRAALAAAQERIFGASGVDYGFGPQTASMILAGK